MKPTLAAAMLKARHLVAGGWSPGLTVDVDGRIALAEAEDAARFSLLDALRLGCGGDAAGTMKALDVVALLAEPGHARTWMDWELAPARTQKDVVGLLDRAVMRAAAITRGTNT